MTGRKDMKKDNNWLINMVVRITLYILLYKAISAGIALFS